MELQEALGGLEEATSRRLPRSFDTGGCLEQVRPADVAHEDEVAGGDANRLARSPAQVRHEEAHMLWRVTGRVKRLDANVADLKRIPVFKELDVVIARLGPAILPVFVPLV